MKDLGVNRISMGVQSLDDATLADMGRGYTIDEAARAFARVKRFFDNAGIDLIVGYPGDEVKVVGVMCIGVLIIKKKYCQNNKKLILYICLYNMATLVKGLTRRIVVPLCKGSIPLCRPIR